MEKIREIQMVELDILKKLDEVCRWNDLRYAMAFGTMLGAVRHKGFIPWDDDVDVFMPYKDVRKLKEVFHSEGYFFQNEDTEKESPFCMYKIRKNSTLMLESQTKRLNIHQGIWIDIFPVFPAAKPRYKKLQYKLGLCIIPLRRRHLNANDGRRIYKLLIKFPNRFLLLIDHALQSLIFAIGDSNGDELYYITDDRFELCFYDKALFSEFSEYSFENASFIGFKQYDEYLRREYGEDYMIPRKFNVHAEDYSSVITCYSAGEG